MGQMLNIMWWFRAIEMAQYLRAFTVLTEDLAWAPVRLLEARW